MTLRRQLKHPLCRLYLWELSNLMGYSVNACKTTREIIQLLFLSTFTNQDKDQQKNMVVCPVAGKELLDNKRTFLKKLPIGFIIRPVKTPLEAPTLPCSLHESISRILNFEASVNQPIPSGNSCERYSICPL